ncbi:Putative xanthine dehydrogenase yagR molybdenum-binding subunit [Nitrospirillum viridazoti Y2]|nr:Putative xanthine dehydrogenase yagR molybdenum-binding subunit [Nitrospirillum amazonense Y2]
MPDAVPPPPGQPSPGNPSPENMGAPVARIDGRLKVTGQARYPADTPLRNLAHGVMVTSTIARGRIRSLDTTAAASVPGVLLVLTRDQAQGQLTAPKFGTGGSTSIQPLNEERIWHDGQMVAIVVAETPEAAREAADLVAITYDHDTPSAGFDTSGVEIVAGAGASPMYPEDPKAGDFDTAFKAAPVVLDATYNTAAQHHNPMELFSTTAEWNDGQLTVYEPSQFVAGWRAQLAKQLDMDAANIRVVSEYIGGAFGSKGPMTPRTAAVALAAKLVKRPVRCVCTRAQGYTTATFRAETRQRIRMGAGRDGKIRAFSHEGWELTSRPDDYVVGGTETTARLYAYGAVHTKVQLVKADRNTPGYMRSPPETPYVFGLECAMDEMAEKLGLDPVEFRRVNDTQADPVSGKRYTSRSLMRCYDEAAAAFGWQRRLDAGVWKTGAMREGDWLVGLGCATAVYPTQVAPCAARVRLTVDGKALLQTSAHEIGTGVRTVAAQTAAGVLGLSVEDVTVEMGDSALPAGPVAGGSVSTASVCSAVLKACGAIRDKLYRAATVNSGPPATPESFTLRGGMAVLDSGRSAPLSALFQKLGTTQLEEYAEFAPEGSAPGAVEQLRKGNPGIMGGAKGPVLMYAFGAEFVEVRVHARTGEIRVPRMVGAFAAGRIMNPRTARSQLMGGMIWGLGAGLHEATEIDPRHARAVNRDLQDYLVPVNADVEGVEVILVPETDTEVNPAGVKGLGELGNVGTSSAIASALYHATGRRLRDIPMRLDKLLQLQQV